ncbi:PRD domain-containing protein [Changpingibacter yushuensis]|uniref:PRD domain-containing protein n=1 Tax=Changpingibacter yushuensis TaxID=2758440 RepID=UPI0015F48D47|nr:PRD domain-containing protein [Changpingibacter yushuensis]
MEIVKVLNNNVVLITDSDGTQRILTGRGIGFQKSPGQHVDLAKVIQVFSPETREEYVTLRDFLLDISPEYVALARTIVDLAEASWNVTFPESLTIALADHISFAVKRAEAGDVSAHPLKSEVRQLFPAEFHMAKEAVRMAREDTHLPISDEETTAITLHLVNANAFAGNDMSKTFEMTETLTQVFDVLRSIFDRDFASDDINTARFITHLRYFFTRAANDQQLQDQSEAFNESVRDSFPVAAQAAQRVRVVLEMRLDARLTDDELTYLILHIARLTGNYERKQK